ncbi:MaoC/PaaZ C-terminal domain-containing protein, partial [Pseudomonas aeruginosa]|uniref:MaoC/PaaZ C-terminal domain-containing protein n=1 Tax=Pseudomonas aeruginosa TaxID=287 RepID=UPI003CC51311
PAAAVRAGFPRPILHGLGTRGEACHAVLRGLADYGAEQLGHLHVRFSAPVFHGETLRTEMWSDGSFRTPVVERELVVLDNGRVGQKPERPV